MNIIEIILCFSVFSSISSKVEGWKGIIPLHSTRADVERLLGPPVKPCKDSCHYDTTTEGVFVRYSGEPCEEGQENRWRVPANTVISLSVNLAEGQKLSDLKLDRRRFRKTEDPELHGYSTYENEGEGISYSVSDEGVVYRIEWFGTSKDAKALRCGSARASTIPRQRELCNKLHP